MTAHNLASAESRSDSPPLGIVGVLVICSLVAVVAVFARGQASGPVLVSDVVVESLDGEIYVPDDLSFSMVIPSDWDEPVVIERDGIRMDVFYAPVTDAGAFATYVTVSSWSVGLGTTLREEMQLEAQFASMNLSDVRTATVDGEQLLIGQLSPVAEEWGYHRLVVMHRAGGRVTSADLNAGTGAFADEVAKLEPFLLSLRSSA